MEWQKLHSLLIILSVSIVQNQLLCNSVLTQFRRCKNFRAIFPLVLQNPIDLDLQIIAEIVFNIMAKPYNKSNK